MKNLIFHRYSIRFAVLTFAVISFFAVSNAARNSADGNFIDSIRHLLSQSAPASSSPKVLSSGEDLELSSLAANGKIAFSSNRLLDIRKIFTINGDGTGVTCLMCAGATDPSGTGTTDPSTGEEPAVSPDSSTIAFFRSGQIWLMNANGTNQRTTGVTGSSPQWSPNGAKITFYRNINAANPPNNEIFIMNVDGSGEVNISNNVGNDVFPAWSAVVPNYPQGRIAFRSSRTGNSEIYVISPLSLSEPFQSAQLSNITNNPAFDTAAKWSLDGTKLVFASSRDDANNEIYTLIPGSTPIRLTSDTFSDSFPTWSPDGTKIVFERFASQASPANYELFTVNAVPGNPLVAPANITNNSSNDFDPSWGGPSSSRTNGKVYFGDGPITSSNIISFQPGTDPFGTGTNLGRGYHPAVSPDGTTVAFVDNTAGTTNNQIMLMNSSGANRRALPNPATGFTPTWSPDGSRLAYVVGNFVTGENGSGNIYVMDMTAENEGANQTIIPNTQNSSNPSWGSANFIVYFSRQSTPGVGIAKLGPIPATALITSNPPPATRLAGAQPNDREPSWSADATKIAFRSFRDYAGSIASEIYSMDANGGSVTRLTNEQTQKTNPTWAPDGSAIAFDGGSSLRKVLSNGSDGTDAPILKFGTARFPHWAAGSASPPAQPVDLFLTAGGPIRIVEQENGQFVVNLVNRSTTPATGVRIVTDPLPTFVQFVPAGSSNTCTLGGDRRLTCTIGTVVIDTGSTIINLRPTQTGTFTFRATATSNEAEASPDPNPNSASIAVTATPSSDVGISLLETPPSRVDLGQNITYRYFITNNGPSTASGVVFDDRLPDSVEFVPSLSTSLFGCRLIGSTVLCDAIGDIENGSSRGITVVVRTRAAGTVSHFGAVRVNNSTDRNPSNDTASVTTLVEAPRVDLELLATAPAEAMFAENVTFAVRVKNNGPSPATNVTVRNDRTTANSAFVSVTGPSCTNSSGVTTCVIGNLGTGSTSDPISLTVKARDVAPISLLFTTFANEGEQSPDPHPNSVTVTTRITVQVELNGLEITQGVQNLSNSIPLVADRPTFVRAHVKASSAVSEGAPVSGYLTAKNLATNTVLGTIINSNVGTTIKLLQTPKRATLDDSIYFQLPSNWTNAGSVEFTFGGNEFSPTCNEADAVKDCKVTLQFQTRRKFSIKFFMTTYIDVAGNTYAPSTADLAQAMAEIRASFPMADFGTALQTTWTTRQEYCTVNGIFSILQSLKTMRANDCGPTLAQTGNCRSGIEDFHYVLLPEPFGNGYCSTGIAATGMADTLFDRDGIKRDNTGNTAVAVAGHANSRAHELGHNFGLRHTCFAKDTAGNFIEQGCGIVIPPDGTISVAKNDDDALTYYGFDPIRETITGLAPTATANTSYTGHKRPYNPNTPDMMSYGPAAWPSAFNYLRLFNTLSPTASLASGPERKGQLMQVPADKLFLIDGTVSFSDGTGQIGGVYTLDSLGSVTPPPVGDYAIRFEDSQGNQLATYSFQVGQSSEGDRGAFALLLPKDPAARRIVLLRNGQIIATRQASANSPTVTVTSPNGGETLNGPTTNFTWTAADQDNDALTYVIEYSTDGGTTWTTLAANWNAASYPVDLTRLPASNRALIRVTASDGFNSAQDQSNAVFTVPSHAPEAAISAPENNHIYVADQTVNLNGMVLDIEEGLVAGSRLTWSSNLNGPLGTGSSLAINASTLQEGTHTITLSATDSTARVGTASISIRVFRTRPVFPAALSVGPTGLAFSANFGSVLTAPQTLAIRNSGDGDLTWSATADQPWIQLNSVSGRAPSNVDVSINPTGLAPGNYSGIITISTANAANSPQVINVSLAIIQGPPATINGRVLTPDGRGLRNAVVSLIDSQNIRRTATTSSFGLYSFGSVPSGGSYTITVSSKRYRFTPRVLTISGNLSNVDFVGLE